MTHARDILSTVVDREDIRFRLLGVLPLVFFLAQAVHYWRVGGFGNLLWMCNISNLLLAIGLLLNHRELIRAAAIWTIPGLGIWGWYVMKDANLTSMLAHVGGIIVGLIALRRVRMDRFAWIYAFAWYLFMLLAARLLTSSQLNVNVAHHIQPGWENAFGSYWKFLIAMCAVGAIMLWIVGRVFFWFWPAETASEVDDARSAILSGQVPLPEDSEPASASARKS